MGSRTLSPQILVVACAWFQSLSQLLCRCRYTPHAFLRYFEGMGEDSVAASGGNSEKDYLLDESSVTMMMVIGDG